MSGLTSLTGNPDGPPMLTGTYVSDFLTGVYAALGAVLAPQARAQSGRGQWVRMNLLHCLMSILNTIVTRLSRVIQFSPGMVIENSPAVTRLVGYALTSVPFRRPALIFSLSR